MRDEWHQAAATNASPNVPLRAADSSRDGQLSGPLNAWWFNPRTGLWHVDGVESAEMAQSGDGIAAGPGAAAHVFDPPTGPGPGLDWVLVLCRNAALF